MKQKIKNLATLAAFLGTSAIGTNCVREYHHYHPIEVREEPVEQPKLTIEIPVVVNVEQPKKCRKTIEHKVRQMQLFEVPGKETVYETGDYFVILDLVRCAQQAQEGRREGNRRLPYQVWAFREKIANPMKEVGIGSSFIRVKCGRDTTVIGTSREKAQEILEESRKRHYKQAYIEDVCTH